MNISTISASRTFFVGGQYPFLGRWCRPLASSHTNRTYYYAGPAILFHRSLCYRLRSCTRFHCHSHCPLGSSRYRNASWLRAYSRFYCP